MSINHLTCEQIITAVQDAIYDETTAQLPVAFFSHMRSCSRCRGAMVVLAHTIVASSAPPGILECGQVHNDLAAFVDLDVRDPVLALRLYPAVWWHLWTCATCSDTYWLTRSLLDATASDDLPPLPN